MILTILLLIFRRRIIFIICGFPFPYLSIIFFWISLCIISMISTYLLKKIWIHGTLLFLLKESLGSDSRIYSFLLNLLALSQCIIILIKESFKESHFNVRHCTTLFSSFYEILCVQDSVLFNFKCIHLATM